MCIQFDIAWSVSVLMFCFVIVHNYMSSFSEKKKVWSALTMLAEYGSVECSINVQCNQDKSDGLAAVLCK